MSFFLTEILPNIYKTNKIASKWQTHYKFLYIPLNMAGDFRRDKLTKPIFKSCKDNCEVWPEMLKFNSSQYYTANEICKQNKSRI